MPEFVACPACGCRVQMSESMLGKAVRCISCNHRFTAASPTEAETQRVDPMPARESATPHPTLPHPRGEGRVGGPPPLPLGFDDPAPLPRRPVGEPDEDRGPAGPDWPCCPRCGRRVAWEAFRCANCGQELEIDPAYQRFGHPDPGRLRRDCEPHRGPMLAGMGHLSLAIGLVTLCIVGLPALIALPLGITTWVMASNDLAKMRAGEMETQGRLQTEGARTSAITGVLLSLFFAAGWGLWAMSRMLP